MDSPPVTITLFSLRELRSGITVQSTGPVFSYGIGIFYQILVEVF
jgi:hypothetical protein